MFYPTLIKACKYFLTFKTAEPLINKHLLHGIPNIPTESYCMLPHQDYVNAYNKEWKLPHYVAYTLKSKVCSFYFILLKAGFYNLEKKK